MKLNKEECVEYLETLKNFACLNASCCMQTIEEIKQNKKLFNECINYFEQLIKEHFDNPPLKFEELKEGMWVWDTKFCNERNLYEPTMIYITKVEMDSWGERIFKYPTVHYKTVIKPLFGTFDAIKFEDNRFYRKEVLK